MTKRRKISLKEKLASALCEMMRPDESGKLVRIIPYAHQKMMTADQVVSLFEWHHNILHAHDGVDEHWNIEPMTIAEHARETNGRSKPIAAKVKRIRGETSNGPRRRIPSRPNAWAKGRKIRSRGFATAQTGD
jgi:hypothetical protein